MITIYLQVFNYVFLFFRQGSVIVNFTVFYVEVKQGEILLLQDYVTTTGKLYNLSTIFQDVKPVKGKPFHRQESDNLKLLLRRALFLLVQVPKISFLN